MSLHAKWNQGSRPRVLGAVTGVALLLGGGFAVQAVADSDVKPASTAPKVTTGGDSAPQVTSDSAGSPKVVKPGKAAGAGKAVGAGTSGAGSDHAGNAPRVISPGTGVQK
ncbi:hypothetical protein [Streptomyces beijiangensis]|uniref:Uncharacterized protein n=1 Tax=Streptomyces beijiangensis TaxID=163361 RepID=A0A939FA14_9ACTN|nr:hypothetical protein [Streptomyces beijiangensis]MBO0513225.1 hypothetical protein [Streptomyces beijiangensis]